MEGATLLQEDLSRTSSLAFDTVRQDEDWVLLPSHERTKRVNAATVKVALQMAQDEAGDGWDVIPPEERRYRVDEKCALLRKEAREAASEEMDKVCQFDKKKPLEIPAEQQPGVFALSYLFENQFLKATEAEEEQVEVGGNNFFRNLRPAGIRAPLHEQGPWRGDFVRAPDKNYKVGDELLMSGHLEAERWEQNNRDEARLVDKALGINSTSGELTSEKSGAE